MIMKARTDRINQTEEKISLKVIALVVTSINLTIVHC